VGAVLFYPVVARPLETLLEINEQVADFIGFIAIFVAAVILGAVVSSLVDRTLKGLRVKWIDRLLGACFGFLRGFLINVVIFLALTAFPVNKGLLASSRLAGYFLNGAEIIVYYAPADFRDRFVEGYEWLFEFWTSQTSQEEDE
jgi:membrane protein required for colicin V production